MKFIHAADIHLDCLSGGFRNLYGKNPLSISKATEEAFVKLIDLAINESVDFLVIAGDLFDANWRDYRLGLLFIEQVKRLKCPIFYMRGNHDAENRLLKKLTYPSHVYQFTSNAPQTHLLKDLKVAVHGQSYEMYHTRKDLSSHYPEAIPGYFNIGLLHTSGDVKLGNTPYSPYITNELVSKKYHYWALGHVHHHHTVLSNPPVVYSGCIQGRHIKESGEKGCCLVHVDSELKVRYEFKPLSNILWQTISIDLTKIKDESSFRETLLNEIDSTLNHRSRLYLIRLELTGTSLLENDPSKEKDYYEHEIGVWLDRYNGHVRLEKIVNHSRPQNLISDLIQSNEVLSELILGADRLKLDRSALEYTYSLISLLKERAPQDFIKNPYFRHLEDIDDLSEIGIKIKDQLLLELAELLNETTSN